MKRISLAIAGVVGLAAAGSAFASYIDYARVDRVDRVVAMSDRPQTQRDCWDQPRTEYHPGRDYHRETVVPSEDEYGNPAQTVIRDDVVETGGYSTTHSERVCETRTAHVPAQQVIGFDVVYTYRGQDYHDRLDHDPGRSVRVRVDHGYVEADE